MQPDLFNSVTAKVLVVVLCCCGHTRCGAEDVDRFARVESTQLDHVIRVTEKVICGGEPKTKDAFAELFRLGVRTVVSVDGARPDVETARNFGMRYVHIPVGYDRIGLQAEQSIARAIRESEEPIYVHCHHGRHRGPAAAAIAGIASGDLNRQEAIALLNQAGTSKDYPGLWHAVESFQLSPQHVTSPPLVESADVQSVVAAMAEIARAFETLENRLHAEGNSQITHHESKLHHLGLLIVEGLKEYRRNQPAGIEADFNEILRDTESQAKVLLQLLKSNRIPEATDALSVLSDSCKKCHESYRN